MSVDWTRLRNDMIADQNRFYLVLSGDKDFMADEHIFVSVNGQVVAVRIGDLVDDFVTRLISKRVENGDEILIITGDNKGVDRMAEAYGTKHNYDVYIYEAHWDEYGNKAGYMRNEEMFYKVCTRKNKACILFWDGENKSTHNLIYLAETMGVRCKVYNYRRKSWLTQEEIKAVSIEEKRNQMRYA